MAPVSPFSGHAEGSSTTRRQGDAGHGSSSVQQRHRGQDVADLKRHSSKGQSPRCSRKTTALMPPKKKSGEGGPRLLQRHGRLQAAVESDVERAPDRLRGDDHHGQAAEGGVGTEQVPSKMVGQAAGLFIGDSPSGPGPGGKAAG